MHQYAEILNFTGLNTINILYLYKLNRSGIFLYLYETISQGANIPTKDFISTLTLNFHSIFPLVTGALFYNIGQTSIRPRLSQDLLHL